MGYRTSLMTKLERMDATDATGRGAKQDVNCTLNGLNSLNVG